MLALTACGGGGGGGGAAKTETVVGSGFRFQAPAGWSVDRKPDVVRARDGAVDLVSVRTFPLLRRYRPALFRAVRRELDRSTEDLAIQLGGRVASHSVVRAGGGDAHSYRIEFDGKIEELTFVLRGKREYELLCRRSDSAARTACSALVSSFVVD